MAEAASNYDGMGLTNSTTYALWDANMIYGCVCDEGFYGYDCSLQYCPLGDDPLTTGQTDEVQHVVCTCDGCSGTWTFSYRGETTVAIAYNADSTAVATAINALSTITAVTVAFSGSVACENPGNLITVTFTNDPGDLLASSVVSSLTGGTNSLFMRTTQTITCTCQVTCSGGVVLKYRGEETATIANNAATTDVVTALEVRVSVANRRHSTNDAPQLFVADSASQHCSIPLPNTHKTLTTEPGAVVDRIRRGHGHVRHRRRPLRRLRCHDKRHVHSGHDGEPAQDRGHLLAEQRRRDPVYKRGDE